MSIKTKFALAATVVGVLAMSAAASMPSWCPAWRNGQAPAGSPVATHGALRVEGNKIVNKDGQPVQLRGPSLFWSMPPGGSRYYTADVVRELRRDWNATVVRAAMGVERNFGGDQRGFIGNPDGNRQLVLNVIEGAIASGMYVIIDWHSYVAELHTPTAVTFFREMATCFEGIPNIIYEIYNEPNGCAGADGNNCTNNSPSLPNNRGPFSNGCPWTGTVSGTDGRSVRDHMVAVTNAIRAIDRDNLILIGTPNFCQNPEIATAYGNAIPGSNLVYTAHYYAGANDNVHRAGLRNNIMVAMNRGYPIFISEFGITGADGGQNNGPIDTVEANIWFDFLNDHHIGWAMWYLGDAGNQSSGMLNGSLTSRTTTGNYARSKMLETLPPNRQPAFNYIRSNVVCTGGEPGECGDVVANSFMTRRGTSATASFEARCSEGWEFDSWSGDVTSANRSQSMPFNSDINVTATFRRGVCSVIDPWLGMWCPIYGETSNTCVRADADNWNPETCVSSQGDCMAIIRVPYYCPNSTACREMTSAAITHPSQVSANCFHAGNGGQEACITRCNELGPPEEDDLPGTARCSWDPSSVRHGFVNRNRAWTPSVSGNRFTLSGPSAAQVTLYDMRGRQVRTFAYNGSGQLTISASTAGISRGNYIVAVRELSSGREVYRGRVALVR